jgi:hypothetical protein
MSIIKNINSTSAEISNISSSIGGSKKGYFLNKLITILLSCLSLIVVILIIYETIAKGSSWYTHLLFLGTAILVSVSIAMYSKGSKWDKGLTVVIILIIMGISYFNYLFIVEWSGYSFTNPFVMIYFSVQIFLFSMIIISRFSKLNLVKILSWAFGLMTVLITVFTINIWSSVSICQYANQEGISDSPYITLMVYLGWATVFGSLFAFEEINYSSFYKWITLIIGAGISVWLVGYSEKRCSKVEEKIKKLINVKDKNNEKKAEEIAHREEVTWINNSIHILTAMSFINFLIGHTKVGLWYGFLGFYIVDKCSAPGDIRKVGASTMITLNLIRLFFGSIISNIF